jgi:hypothetical protein
MDVSDMKDILAEALGRVEAVGITLGLDMLNLAGTLADALKEMGVDFVRAASTGEVQP